VWCTVFGEKREAGAQRNDCHSVNSMTVGNLETNRMTCNLMLSTHYLIGTPLVLVLQ
jgi:hypothetical protein